MRKNYATSSSTPTQAGKLNTCFSVATFQRFHFAEHTHIVQGRTTVCLAISTSPAWTVPGTGTETACGANQMTVRTEETLTCWVRSMWAVLLWTLRRKLISLSVKSSAMSKMVLPMLRTHGSWPNTSDIIGVSMPMAETPSITFCLSSALIQQNGWMTVLRMVKHGEALSAWPRSTARPTSFLTSGTPIRLMQCVCIIPVSIRLQTVSRS